MYYWEEIRKDSLDVSLVHLNGEKSLNSNHKLYALVFYCCHNKLVKCSSIGQSSSISLQFCENCQKPEYRMVSLLRVSQGQSQGGVQAELLFESFGKELLPSSFGLLTTWVYCNCGTEVLILLLLEVTCLSPHAFHVVHLQQ